MECAEPGHLQRRIEDAVRGDKKTTKLISTKLTYKKSFTLYPKTPFHFDGTFHKPSHFPDKLDDWEPGRYWQAIRINQRLFGLKIKNKDQPQRPKIIVSVFYKGGISDKELESIKQEIIWLFDSETEESRGVLGRV